MIVRTYKKLDTFIDRWVSGAIDLLLIESEAGLGKTYQIRERLKKIEHLAVNSHITPLETHRQLYEHRDELVWFDDITMLLYNRIQVSILKQLADTTAVKTLCYYTTSELIGDIPMKFITSSRLLISCNRIEGSNPHIAAIKDRGFYIQFQPTQAEIINKLKEIATKYEFLAPIEKEDVLQLIIRNAKHCKNLTLRTLVKGFQLYQYYKVTGIDWQQDLLAEMGISEKLIALNQLLEECENDTDRLKQWQWSKQTFYTYKKMLAEPIVQ